MLGEIAASKQGAPRGRGWPNCRARGAASASAPHLQPPRIIEVVSLTSTEREIRLKGMQFLTSESSMGPGGKGRQGARASRRLGACLLLALAFAGAGAGMHEAFA